MGASPLKYRCMFESPAQPCVLCDCVLCIVFLYVMLGCCGGVYVEFSGGLCSLCWIVVAVVDVVSCTYIYQVLLLRGDAAPIVM